MNGLLRRRPQGSGKDWNMSNSINADWHRDHVLGSNAPMADRIVWHQEHVQVCGCRPIPESVLKAIAEQEPKNGGSGGK